MIFNIWKIIKRKLKAWNSNVFQAFFIIFKIYTKQMTETKSLFSLFYDKLLSENTKKKTEIFFISLAIISFLLHLIIIALVDLEIIMINDYSKLLSDPITSSIVCTSNSFRENTSCGQACCCSALPWRRYRGAVPRRNSAKSRAKWRWTANRWPTPRLAFNRFRQKVRRRWPPVPLGRQMNRANTA